MGTFSSHWGKKQENFRCCHSRPLSHERGNPTKSGREAVKSYLLDFMQQNKVKNFLLMPYWPMYILLWLTLSLLYLSFICFSHLKFCNFVMIVWYVYSLLRRPHWVLLVLRLQRCNFYVLDSMKSPGKDWSLLKDLLDDCLFDWNTTGGYTIEKNYKGTGKKMIAFRWNTLSCMRQPPTSLTCGFYTCICMEEFIGLRKC